MRLFFYAPSADFRPRLCPGRLKFPATIGNDLTMTIRIPSGQYCIYARISLITRPCTSVSRKSRPP